MIRQSLSHLQMSTLNAWPRGEGNENETRSYDLTYRLKTLHHVECENETSLVTWTGCDTN